MKYLGIVAKWNHYRPILMLRGISYCQDSKQLPSCIKSRKINIYVLHLRMYNKNVVTSQYRDSSIITILHLDYKRITI
jgi:hypothetical protein